MKVTELKDSISNGKDCHHVVYVFAELWDIVASSIALKYHRSTSGASGGRLTWLSIAQYT